MILALLWKSQCIWKSIARLQKINTCMCTYLFPWPHPALQHGYPPFFCSILTHTCLEQQSLFYITHSLEGFFEKCVMTGKRVGNLFPSEYLIFVTEENNSYSPCLLKDPKEGQRNNCSHSSSQPIFHVLHLLWAATAICSHKNKNPS